MKREGGLIGLPLSFEVAATGGPITSAGVSEDEVGSLLWRLLAMTLNDVDRVSSAWSTTAIGEVMSRYLSDRGRSARGDTRGLGRDRESGRRIEEMEAAMIH